MRRWVAESDARAKAAQGRTAGTAKEQMEFEMLDALTGKPADAPFWMK